MEMRKIDVAGATPADEAPRRSRWRTPLMLIVPAIVIAIGGFLWLTSGRYVSTDNAYVQQDKVSVSGEVGGRVVSVAVRENQRVGAGDVLYRIDPEPFRIALAQAEASLSTARLQVSQMRETYAEKGTDIGGAQADLTLAQSQLQRQAQLLKAGFTTRANYDDARHAVEAAREKVAGSRAATANARAALGGELTGPLDSHPLVRAALAQVAKAKLDLGRTVVRSPAAGVVSQSTRLLPGQFTVQGVSNVSIVLDGQPWIEANFKETDLENMRAGQPATIKLDAYPHHPLKADVWSIGAGTGATFAVLPTQNATGNWVKVTQRVPVRFRILEKPDFALIAGLSAKVKVDTQPQKG